MRIKDNDCVSCEHCINCGRGDYEIFICDECESSEKLYEYDGKELCAECLLKKFDVVEGSE